MTVQYALSPANRIRLARAFRDVPRVDLAIDAAIEGQMGRAFVDQVGEPAVFEIESARTFLYFAGNSSDPAAHDMLATLPADRLLMPSSPGWLESARRVHGEGLVELERYSFTPASLSASYLEGLLRRTAFRDSVTRIDAAAAAALSTAPGSPFDIADFDSAADFAARGIGFFVPEPDGFAGVAYSSLVCARGIEISIFVSPRRRGRGVATALACALLIWCLQQGAEPHWDAANPESCHLAEKLGYIRTGRYDALYLSA